MRCNLASPWYRSPRARTAAVCRAAVSLYRGEPHWVPPLRRDEHRRLSPAHNPFWEHARSELWLARRGGRITGRIAAIEDRLYNERQRESITWFGFFEAEDAATANGAPRCGRAAGARVEQRCRARTGESVAQRQRRPADRRVRRRSVRADAVQPADLPVVHRRRRLSEGEGSARLGDRHVGAGAGARQPCGRARGRGGTA